MLKVGELTPLGTTPWTTERDRSPEPLKVLLRLPGYADQTEVIELGENAERTIRLTATPAPPAPPVKTNVPVQKPIAQPVAKPVTRPAKPANKPSHPAKDSVDDIPVVR
ncbi:MAG TPA: hypothetical protein PK493_12590 [Pseudomonadota bacterium]|nr:hypothetical protein [Pseudomonadota bacterium]